MTQEELKRRQKLATDLQTELEKLRSEAIVAESSALKTATLATELQLEVCKFCFIIINIIININISSAF